MRLALFLILTVGLGTVLLSESPLYAFTCHKASVGKVCFELEKIPAIDTEGKIYEMPLTIENGSEEELTFSLVFDSIRSVYLYDELENKVPPPEKMTRTITVPAGESYRGVLKFTLENAYRKAHYPIHCNIVYTENGETKTAQLVPVFEVNLTTPNVEERALKPITFQNGFVLNLCRSNGYIPYWTYDKKETKFLPVGWSGSDTTSRATFSPGQASPGSVSRYSWHIHPPFVGGTGTVGVRYPIDLPQSHHIQLDFYNTVREVAPPEPPTDGVTYRIYIEEIPDNVENMEQFASRSAPAAETLVFEKHVMSTRWEKGSVDLSGFAGKRVLLSFESDPGPARDTTCDGGWWGDVLLRSDPVTNLLSADEQKELKAANLKAFRESAESDLSGNTGIPLAELDTAVKPETGRTDVFMLDDGIRVAVTSGKNGICDGVVTIGVKKVVLQFSGLKIRYDNYEIGTDPVPESLEFRSFFVSGQGTLAEQMAEQARRVKSADTSRDVVHCYFWKDGPALRLNVVSNHPEKLESIRFGSTSCKASRVYFGHGYCVEEPEAFDSPGGGFGCSTSHVGFDFENGISLLQATTTPIDSLLVRPSSKTYTLSVHPETCLTLLPGTSGAMNCAMKYRPLYDKTAAPLVPEKAGRYVFDFWGGHHSEVLKLIKTTARYGLTDAMLIQHVWQRYGYDVRLPDIWPPHRGLGTLEKLQEIGNFCKENGIAFGLHDNYIDFYPDADGFSFDSILFNPDGLPQRAWYNPGPDAQSYRWNPAKFKEHLLRNMNLIKSNLMQTAYFVDVFSSTPIEDYYDVDGNFHSRTETLACWNDCFDTIRHEFNDNAMTSSESGSDALIGHLDGADAILSRVTPKQESFSLVLPSKDIEYVPWFDMVNHHRFILHGVGYSNRYEGNAGRSLRGIESDNYLSSEVLTGHALMGDLAMGVRGNVRKYWFLQPFARAVAMDEITGFDFIDNNIHRQKIQWKSGMVVYINRGENDWKDVERLRSNGHLSHVTLPQHGFWFEKQDGKNEIFGGVIRDEATGNIIEVSYCDHQLYFNGRQKPFGEVHPIRPIPKNAGITGATTFHLDIEWDTAWPTDGDYDIFVHLQRPATSWMDHPELYVIGGCHPDLPTSAWEGKMEHQCGGDFAIPADLPDGNYEVLAGLYDPQSGERLPLLGNPTADTRYRMATVEVRGKEGQAVITGLTPNTELDLSDVHLIPNRTPTTFGAVSSLGAFRMEINGLPRITPLPQEPAFTIEFDWFNAPLDPKVRYVVRSYDCDGNRLTTEPLVVENGKSVITIDAQKGVLFAVETADEN